MQSNIFRVLAITRKQMLLSLVILLSTVLFIACGKDSEELDVHTNVVMPADECPHSDPIEWWYYTGLVQTEDLRKFGFEFVIFQASLAEQPGYMSHFAITDVADQSFHHEGYLVSGDQATQGTCAGFDLIVEDWQLSGHQGKDHLVASVDGYELTLDLETTKPIVFQYGNGEMTIGSDLPFYYYSYTNMQAAGTITVDGQVLPVTGTAWMDHQWGDMGTGHEGWDWYSLRLDDQTEIMFFIVRDNDQERFVGGTYIDQAGRATELVREDFQINSLSTWTSPQTNGTYPMGWEINLPAYDLVLTVNPVFEEQEFTISFLNSPIYWEGLCEVSGTRKNTEVTGHAYIELTGYAE